MVCLSPSSIVSVDVAFDMKAMVALMRDLDDAELAAIEDDLDFYHFTGCASPRLVALMSRAVPMNAAA